MQVSPQTCSCCQPILKNCSFVFFLHATAMIQNPFLKLCPAAQLPSPRWFNELNGHFFWLPKSPSCPQDKKKTYFGNWQALLVSSGFIWHGIIYTVRNCRETTPTSPHPTLWKFNQETLSCMRAWLWKASPLPQANSAARQPRYGHVEGSGTGPGQSVLISLWNCWLPSLVSMPSWSSSLTLWHGHLSANSAVAFASCARSPQIKHYACQVKVQSWLSWLSWQPCVIVTVWLTEMDTQWVPSAMSNTIAISICDIPVSSDANTGKSPIMWACPQKQGSCRIVSSLSTTTPKDSMAVVSPRISAKLKAQIFSKLEHQENSLQAG